MRKKHIIKRAAGLSLVLMLALASGCGGEQATSSDGAKEREATVSDENNDSDSEEQVQADVESENKEEESKTVPIRLLVQSKSHYDFSDDDNYNSLYSGSYDLIYLDDESKVAYPELSKSLEAYNEQLENAFLQTHDQYLSEAKEFYDQSEDLDYFEGYSDYNNISVNRADEHFLSLCASVSSYMGGAHGSYGSGGYNYDVKTGKELTLKDVIPDIPSLREVVKDKLKEEYGDEELSLVDDLDQALNEYLTGDVDQACSWYIMPRGVRITFGIYLLAPYSEGEQTVYISFDEHPELFSDIFQVQTGDYIESYNGAGGYTIDIGQNGTADSVAIEPQYNEYGDIESIDVGVNGMKSSIEVYGFDIKARFIHKGESTFLYMELSQENDYRSTYAFRLEEGGVIKVGEYYGYLTGNTPDADYEAEWQSFWSVLFTTPDELYFGTRMQLLSTYEGIAKAVINDKGELELPENYYYSDFYGEYGQLTAKQDVSASVVDKDTHEVISQDGLIKSGSKVKIIGTNGKDTVDLLDVADDTVYRVNINEEWPQTINGVDIEELFDGTMFAG